MFFFIFWWNYTTMIYKTLTGHIGSNNINGNLKRVYKYEQKKFIYWLSTARKREFLGVARSMGKMLRVSGSRPRGGSRWFSAFGEIILLMNSQIFYTW